MRSALFLLACGAFASGALACRDRTVLIAPELPENITFVGLLYPEFPLEPGSGLFPVEAGRFEIEVEPPPEADALLLVGFTGAQLERYHAPDASVLASRHLLTTETGYASMQSSFSATGSLSPLTNLDADRSPKEVSAEWRPPCINIALDGERVAHIPCLEGACAGHLEQTNCELHVEGPGCALDVVGTVERDARVTFPSGSKFSVCQGSKFGPNTTLECEGPVVSRESCPIDLFAPAWEAPRLLADFAVVDLGAGTGALTPGADYLLDLVLGDGRLSVLSGNGAVFGDRTCPSNSSLVFVDDSTLDIIAQVPGPPCPWAMAYDPDLDTLLVVHSSTVHEVSRFDLLGNRVTSVELPTEVQRPDWYPVEAFLEETSRAFVIAFGPDPALPGDDAPNDWRLLVLDADTLQPRTTALVVPRLTQLMFQGAPGEVIVPHGDATLSVLEARGVNLRRGLATGALCGSAGRFHGGVRDDVHNRYLLSGRAKVNHGVAQIEMDGSACHTASSLDSARSPLALAIWPADPNLVIAGLDGVLNTVPLNDATLAFFDREKRRFLMGEQPVGRGRVKDIQPDGRGGVFMLLPGEAKIVRASPAE